MRNKLPSFETEYGECSSLCDSRSGLTDFLRPHVEDANASAPTYSRIFKEMILVARRHKPVSRTMKGTIERKAALQAYEQEIDALSVSAYH